MDGWFDKLAGRGKKKAESVRKEARDSAANVTAMIDTALQRIDTEDADRREALERAKRRAVNTSRKVIAQTGQYKLPELPDPK